MVTVTGSTVQVMKRKMPEGPMSCSLSGYVVVGYVLPFFALSASAQVTSQQGNPGLQQPAQFDYGVSLGAGYSDNIGRTSSNERSETYASAGLDLVFKQDSRRLYSDSQIDVAYLNYLRNTFSDEVVGNANINLDARIVPGTFDWMLLDNFGQVRSDPFAPASPDNRENVNYVTTGPRFTGHLGATNRVQLGGHYSKITYQRSDADNDRYGANAALIHDFSMATNASLNVSTERTNYSNDVNSEDLDTNSVYMNYTLNDARTRAMIDLGYSKIKRDSGNVGGSLVRVQVERQLTSATRLTLRGGRELTSSGDVFRDNQSTQPVGLNLQSATVATDPFLRKYIELSWDFARSRTRFGVDVAYAKESHEEQVSSDRKSTTGNMYISRDVTPTLTTRLSANYMHDSYDSSQSEFKELSESLALAWRIGRLLTADLQVQHYSRSSDISVTDYRENRVWLQLIYGTARAL